MGSEGIPASVPELPLSHPAPCLRQRVYVHFLGTKPLLPKASIQEHECFEGGPVSLVGRCHKH